MNTAFPKVGVGGIVIHQDQVLLVRRKHPPHQGLWAIPGGHLGWGESVQMAIERELREETGLSVVADGKQHVIEVMDGGTTGCPEHHFVVIDVECALLGGELLAGTDASEAAWFTAKSLDFHEVSPATVDLLRLIGFYQGHKT